MSNGESDITTLGILVKAGNIGARLWIRRPAWDSINGIYKKESAKSAEEFFRSIFGYTRSEVGKFNEEDTSAARLSVAFMASNMMKDFLNNNTETFGSVVTIKTGPLANNRFIAKVTEMKKWLFKIWGDADVVVQYPRGWAFVAAKIKGRCGVFIITGDKGNYATLWTGKNVIQGKNHIERWFGLGSTSTIFFWELKRQTEPVIDNAYFAQKVVEGNEVYFEAISSSILGKIVYLIVETQNMQNKELRVSVLETSALQNKPKSYQHLANTLDNAKPFRVMQGVDFSAEKTEITRKVGDFEDLKDSECYSNLMSDYADNVIIELRLGPIDKKEFNELEKSIESNPQPTKLSIVVKTGDEALVYYGCSTKEKCNVGVFLIKDDGFIVDPKFCDPLDDMSIVENRASNLLGWVRIGDDGKNNSKLHQGFDYYADIGTDIKAVAHGKVEFIVSDPGPSEHYGKQIAIKIDDSEYYAFYAHLSEISNGITKGARVKRGQVIGKTGKTGNASRKEGKLLHLHFECRKSPKPGTGLNGRIEPNTIVLTKFYSQNEEKDGAGRYTNTQTDCGVKKINADGTETLIGIKRYIK